MRLTILSTNVRGANRDDPSEQESLREKTIFHNELVDAICDASLERAEYLYSLSQKEELSKKDDPEEDKKAEKPKKTDEKKTSEESKEPKEESKYDIDNTLKEADMEVDFEKEFEEPCLEMDFEYMSYSNLVAKGKTKDVFEKDPLPLALLSKTLRKRYFLRELNGACKRIVYKVPLYFLRSNSYIYLFKKSLDVMKKLLKAFFIMQNLCKKYQDIDLLMEKNVNNTLIVLIMLICCRQPKNDLYEIIRTYNSQIFNEMILNIKFLKEILVPVSDPKSKINEMIKSCENKKIDVKNIEKEDLNIFHYTIIGSGMEYVLNHLKFIGKPPLKYHAMSNFKMDYKSEDKEIENIVESYPELLFNLLEVLNEAFMNRTEEAQNSPGHQSIMHLQTIILNNLFKIIINCFRYLKTAE